MRRRIIGVSWTFDFASFHVSDNPNRRATCYLQTLKYKQAIADFKKLLTLEPQNQLVRTQLDSTQKILRKVEFEKVLPGTYFGTALDAKPEWNLGD